MGLRLKGRCAPRRPAQAAESSQAGPAAWGSRTPRAQADHAQSVTGGPVVGPNAAGCNAHGDGPKPFDPNHFLTLEADRALQAICKGRWCIRIREALSDRQINRQAAF